MITSPLTIHSSNRLFERDGRIHTIKSVTAFNLIHQFNLGKDIDPFLKTYNRSNELVILSSTDGPNTPWGNDAWPLPSGQLLVDFCNYVGERNWDVEFILITGNQPEKIQPLRNIVEYLRINRVPNLTFEAGNEPHLNKSDVNLLKSVLDSSGYLYSSGIYNDNNIFFGHYVDYHPARDSEWMRKCHDGLEYWTGQGPNYKEEKALKVPSKANEPIRPDLASFNQLDFYTFGAGLKLFGCGGCFHSQSGKLGQLPTIFELECYNAFMNGIELFPADSVLGIYNRPVENSLRTYTVGRFMLRIHPVGDNPFSEVYDIPLDTFDIAYSLDPLVVPADPPNVIPDIDDDMPKHSYAAMADLNERMRAAYRMGELGRTQTDMPAMTVSHLLWRYFFEGYTEDQLIADAKLRGEGIVPN